MSGSTRTQIYLTAEQREAIDALIQREGRSLAWVVREALDSYLADRPGDLQTALDGSFGKLPDLIVPSREESSRFPVGTWEEMAKGRRSKSVSKAASKGG